MEPSESLHDILEEPTTSEWGDDEFEEELNLEVAGNQSARKASSRSDKKKSADSQARENSKHSHLTQLHPPVFGFTPNTLKRDPTIESIIESRKSTVIENAYTRLAQTTSHSSRPIPLVQVSSPKVQLLTVLTEGDEHSNDKQDQEKISQPTSQLDQEKWDDGLNGDFDRQSVASIDKSSLQVYDETCKRLNICPCSMVIRSLNTTKINLQNYGLGPKGSAALAVALVRNTNVLSINLSGNNIGSSGMSHIYQILTENTYIDDYDLSYNNLGTNGIRKLADSVGCCVHLKTLSIAGNDLSGSDVSILLSKLEDHPNIKDLNLSHNFLDEDGGIYVAKWLGDNNVLLHLNISWCSIRLMGARAVAKAIGDNNKLMSLNLSNNSFANDTLEVLTSSLTRNLTLNHLNLSGNQIFCRFDTRIKEDPSILILGKEAFVYRLIVAAATNQALKIFQIGKNHLDARCVLIMLEALFKLENISLEELDLTGLTLNFKQVVDVQKLFETHPKLTCYVGPVRLTVEHFSNNLLNLIQTYRHEHQLSLVEIFIPVEEGEGMPDSVISYNQFRDGLRRAKIPFPQAQIENIMKYLGKEDEPGTIALKALETA